MTTEKRRKIYLQMAQEADQASDNFFVCHKMRDVYGADIADLPEYLRYRNNFVAPAWFDNQTIHAYENTTLAEAVIIANKLRVLALLFCAEMTKTENL